jgi:hypothetical protein
MLPPIFQVCSASSPVKALLGSSPVRVWPFGSAPQGAATPYAVWQLIGGNPENYLGNTPDADRFSIQIDVYADTGGMAMSVAETLRDAIEPYAYITAWGTRDRDPTIKAYRVSFDVDWIVERT